MPIPVPLVAAGISGVANIASNLFNAGSIRRENTRQRQFAMDMYDRQRKDALADWNMQNEYNDPKAMMARLRAAGLNPNLAYGNPTTAGQAGSVRQSSQGSYSGKTPTTDLSGISNAFMLFYDLQKTQAETEYIKAQKALAEERTTNETIKGGLMGSQQQKVAADIALALQKFDQLRITNPDQAEKLKQEIKNLTVQHDKILADTARATADTTFKLDENQRRQALQAPTLAAAFEKLVVMKLQEENLYANTSLARARREEVLAKMEAILKGLDLTEAQKDLLQKKIDWYDSEVVISTLQGLLGKAFSKN